MKFVAVIVALLVAPGLAIAQDSTAEPSWRQLANEILASMNRFKLWNACNPVRLAVAKLNDDASEIGLTKERIETLVRSRLRAARIYEDDAHAYELPYLFVNVHVVGSAFSMRLELRKTVIDAVSREERMTSTWHIGSTGMHIGDASFILQGISEHTDKFIDEYLRVNAKACR